MAAPSGIVWGSKVGTSPNQGRIGIYVKLTTSSTEVDREVQVWFWSQTAVDDSSNTLYYDCDTSISEATSSKGSVSIKTTNTSGWHENNQQLLKTYTYTYDRGTSDKTYKIYAKLSGINVVNSTMYANTTFKIPALDTYTISYNANGGSGAPSSQKKTYGKDLTLSNTKPKRTGYTFDSWNTKANGSGTKYSAGSAYKANSAVTLYAIWSEHYLTVNYYSNYADSGTLEGKALSVSASTNAKVATGTFYYDNSYSDGLANIQNKNYLYLSRTGYNSTGNWGTSTSGGTLINQATSYSTGQALAKALGKDLSSGNASINIYAQWSIKTYTISYNANGGSGAPNSQTKNHGQTLTLSSIQPTRSGYTFTGWGTSASDTSVDYSAGGSYTANSAITLYAIWKINTYKVTYNPNGGSGAPSEQTKTYGVNLTLSTTKPTRTNYTFKGWATSTNGSVAYASGAAYTANANITLYAVWELAYVKPKITELTVGRCDESNNLSDQGAYALVTFKWTTFHTSSSITIDWKETVGGSYNTKDKYSKTNSNVQNGTVTQKIGGSFNTEKVYTIRVTVADNDGNASATFDLPASIYHIDCKPPKSSTEVGGVAIGKPAELDGIFDVGYSTRFSGGIEAIEIDSGTDFNTLMTPNVYIGKGYLASKKTIDGEEKLVENYTPCPILENSTFQLIVSKLGTSQQIKQRIELCHKTAPKAYERFYYGGSWGNWVDVGAFGNVLLWEPQEGIELMGDGSVAYLSQNVLDLPKGIVLIFSQLNNAGELTNYNWNCFFVPKFMVSQHSSVGHSFTMATADFSVMSGKWIRVYNDRVTGDGNNTKSGTAASGITYDNGRFALRYVIGV